MNICKQLQRKDVPQIKQPNDTAELDAIKVEIDKLKKILENCGQEINHGLRVMRGLRQRISELQMRQVRVLTKSIKSDGGL